MNWLSNKPIRVLALSLILIVGGGKAAYAQYYGLGSGLGYSYLGMGSSLLYPLLYLGGRAFNSSVSTPYPYLPYNGAYYNPNNNFFNNTYAYRLTPPANYSYQPPQGTNPANDVFNSGLPPAAPDRRTIGQNSNYPQANPAALNGFFQSVSTHYHNDLSKALHQSDMRSWAESIGLINSYQTIPNHFNKSRQNEISTVLRDNSLDPQAKLDLLRLLIK